MMLNRRNTDIFLKITEIINNKGMSLYKDDRLILRNRNIKTFKERGLNIKNKYALENSFFKYVVEANKYTGPRKLLKYK